MTATDHDSMWITASTDTAAEEQARVFAHLRVAASAVWPWLAGAQSQEEYVQRKALADDRLTAVVATVVGRPDVDLKSRLTASLDEDFTALHAERAAQKIAAGLQAQGSTYCPNHGVYVGDGNREQHDHCKTEQRESKDSTKTAGTTVEVNAKPKCDVCRHLEGKDAEADYDARLPGLGGSWGNVCQRHFDEYGPGGVGTGDAQKYVVKAAAKTAGKSLKGIGKTSDPNVFSGTDPQGQKVFFKVSDSEAEQLRSIMYSDLAMNFSGVEVEPQDIVMNPDLMKGSAKTAGAGWSESTPVHSRDDARPGVFIHTGNGTFATKCATCGETVEGNDTGGAASALSAHVTSKHGKTSGWASLGSRLPFAEAATDPTNYGVGGDHCPHCGADWKQPHNGDCLRQTNPRRARELEAQGEVALQEANDAWRKANPGPHTCPMCSGSGKAHDGSDCRNCGGKGSWTYASVQAAWSGNDGGVYTGGSCKTQGCNGTPHKTTDPNPLTGVARYKCDECGETYRGPASTANPERTKVAAYVPHKWVDSDGFTACIVCGIPEDEAMPPTGPMVGCEGSTPPNDPPPYHDPMDEPISQYASRTASGDYEPSDCPDCSGTGSVPAGGGEKPEDVDNGYVRCPSCGGSGEETDGDRAVSSLRSRAERDVWDERPEKCDFPGCGRAHAPNATRCSEHMGKQAANWGQETLLSEGKCANCRHDSGVHKSVSEDEHRRCTKCDSCPGFMLSSGREAALLDLAPYNGHTATVTYTTDLGVRTDHGRIEVVGNNVLLHLGSGAAVTIPRWNVLEASATGTGDEQAWNEGPGREPTVVDYAYSGAAPWSAQAAQRQAVDESAQGTDRYQRTRHPEQADWVNDEWDEGYDDSLEQGRAGRSNEVMGRRVHANPYDPTTNPYSTSGPGSPSSEFADGKSQDEKGDQEVPGSEPVTTRPRVIPSGGGNDYMPGEMSDSVRPPADTSIPTGTGDMGQPSQPRQGQPSRAAAAEQRWTQPPSANARVAAKVAEITQGLLATNPGMNAVTAQALAAETVRRYPAMLGGGTD